MTSVVLQPDEFIIKLDNNLLNLIDEKEDFNVVLTNPHKEGQFEEAHFQVLQALLYEVIQKHKDHKR